MRASNKFTKSTGRRDAGIIVVCPSQHDDIGSRCEQCIEFRRHEEACKVDNLKKWFDKDEVRVSIEYRKISEERGC